ncbi:MAG: GNAT family N-acetyltransferase [Micromonosporaceae bacterium]|nr:GNAT family N-acetyltransferase [Micromonosporaceae bacterium]
MTRADRLSVPVFRPATIADVAALTELERIANEASIGHLFIGIPFPTDEVAARWRAEVDDPSKTVEVAEADRGLACFVCFDAHRLQHLAVHPDHWGRGLARAAVDRAVARMTGDPGLWCLRDNTRARGLYEHLGWTLTDRTRRSEYPPYHPEVEYVLRRPGA